MEQFNSSKQVVSTNQSTSSQYFIKCKDHMVSGETFSLVFDEQKELLITTPQPMVEELDKYYESDAYISHTDSKKGMVSFLYQKVKKYSLKKKMRLVSSLQKKGNSILDIGAGTGDFLFQAKRMGWKVAGVEVNPSAKALALEKGIRLNNSIDSLKGEKYNVITLWHVLEHIPNLEETLQQIETMLEPNGIILIAVPNYKSFDANHYKEFWAAYDVPRHLWHFSKKSMRHLFSPNIELIKIKPMWFDAFYVSLLSEKYKNGKSFSLRAFWIGWLSNFKGMSSKEYSSHIYCFKSKQ